MITLREFAALPEHEREIRFQELSPHDRSFVRLHEGEGAEIPEECLSPEESDAVLEEDARLLGISLDGLKNGN